MQTAKLFQNGRSQAVRLPKEYQFTGEEVFIQKHGNAVLLVPHEKAWAVFMEGLTSFSDDFMKDGRDQGLDQERKNL
jgi:antitoxin VapB